MFFCAFWTRFTDHLSKVFSKFLLSPFTDWTKWSVLQAFGHAIGSAAAFELYERYKGKVGLMNANDVDVWLKCRYTILTRMWNWHDDMLQTYSLPAAEVSHCMWFATLSAALIFRKVDFQTKVELLIYSLQQIAFAGQLLEKGMEEKNGSVNCYRYWYGGSWMEHYWVAKRFVRRPIKMSLLVCACCCELYQQSCSITFTSDKLEIWMSGRDKFQRRHKNVSISIATHY